MSIRTPEPLSRSCLRQVPQSILLLLHGMNDFLQLLLTDSRGTEYNGHAECALMFLLVFPLLVPAELG